MKRKRLFDTASRSESGFSFVEMAVASAIFATLMGAVLSLVSAGGNASESGIARTRLEGRARAALDKIANEVRGSQILPFANGAETATTITFKRRYAYSGTGTDPYAFDLSTGDVRWNALPSDEYRWEISPAEQQNGVDDDGNGLVDEGVLAKISNGTRTVLCQDVAPNGLTFRLVSPRKLEISLRVLGVDGRKNHITVDSSTLVFLRN
jgi:pilin/secretion family protein with methylation motif